jgi:hypothetical protein
LAEEALPGVCLRQRVHHDLRQPLPAAVRCILVDTQCPGADVEQLVKRVSHSRPTLLINQPQELPAAFRDAVFATLSAEEVLDVLPGLAARALISDLFSRGRQTVTGRRWIRQMIPLRDALLRAYDRPPVTRPQSLAKAGAHAYKQLQRAWDAGFEDPGRPSRTHFVQAISFFRIIELSLEQPDWPWSRIAAELGVTTPTVSARYRQFAGCTPDELNVRRVPGLLGRLEPLLLPRIGVVAPTRLS